MKNCYQKNSEFIRHFTDVDALFHILKGGIRFSKPSDKWDDRNDKYGLDKYAELIGKDIFALCFCVGIGNIHHWTYFGSHIPICGKNSYKNIKCNIKLNKTKTEEALRQKGYQLRPVEYSTTSKLRMKLKELQNLPYLKRNEYCVEQEVRVIAECKKGTNNPIFKIPENCIEGVNVLLDKNSSRLYEKIKNELEKEFPYLKGKIDFNGSMESDQWKSKIDEIISQYKTNIL